MTAMSRLPEIAVTCRHGHSFGTRAHGGQAVDCPQCRADGNRVKVWVRKDRPRNAREIAEHAAIDAPAPDLPGRQLSTELAARWKQEPPWDGQLKLAPGRAGDMCPECSGPVSWEPGRTLTYCPECKRIGLPPAVLSHYERQAQRSAEVAVRDSPDLAAGRAARVRLRALAQRMSERVGEWMDVFDPDGLSDSAERLALDYRAELAAYLPEIRQATSVAELAAIATEIKTVTSRGTSSGAVSTIEQHREAAEQADREARWAEESRQQTEREQAAQARAEHEQAERERAEQARQAAIATRTAKAIQGPALPRNGYVAGGYVGAAVEIMKLVQHSQQKKERKLAAEQSRQQAEREPAAQALDWQAVCYPMPWE